MEDHRLVADLSAVIGQDFNPAIDKYLAQYVRGSMASAIRSASIMKLLWDAIGTEFGGRYELYEMNYAGNHEDIRSRQCGTRLTGTSTA